MEILAMPSTQWYYGGINSTTEDLYSIIMKILIVPESIIKGLGSNVEHPCGTM